MRILSALVLTLFARSVGAAGPPVDRLRDAYRDQAGNLIVTFARAVADQTSGETLGAMYCDPRACTELATQYDQRRDGGPFVRFDFPNGGHGDLVTQPRDGVFRLACRGGEGGDLRPVSKDDVNKLAQALRAGKIDFTPAPETFLPAFVGKAADGRYVYLDADLDRNERLFMGKPGAMERRNFRQAASACDFAGCTRVLETGGVMGVVGSAGGWGATRVQIERFAGAIDRAPLVKINPDADELARLKIPGVPAPRDTNARNPCLPTGTGAARPNAPSPAPSPSAH